MPTEYEAVDWSKVSAGSPIEFQAGNPNTTLNRSVINDHAAQDELNCTVKKGVYQLSDRCRQWAPTPIHAVSTVCADSMATAFTGYCNGVSMGSLGGLP